MSFRVKAIRDIGFDIRLRGTGAQPFEDTTLSMAVRRAGWKVIYDPSVMVDHYESARQEVRYYSHTLPVTDVASFENLAYNNVVALWDELSVPRTLVFAAWSFLVGIRVCPGIVQAIRFTPSMGLVPSWYRFVVAQRGFAKAYWTLSRGPRRPDPACPVRTTVAQPHERSSLPGAYAVEIDAPATGRR